MVLPRLGGRSLFEIPDWNSRREQSGGSSLRELEKIRIHVGWFAQQVIRLARAEGLVLGSRVFLSTRAWQLAKTGSQRARLLIEHELVHVEQYKRLGLMRFLWRYLGEYLGGRSRGMTHDLAYRAISLEQEARDLAAQRVADGAEQDRAMS